MTFAVAADWGQPISAPGGKRRMQPRSGLPIPVAGSHQQGLAWMLGGKASELTSTIYQTIGRGHAGGRSGDENSARMTEALSRDMEGSVCCFVRDSIVGGRRMGQCRYVMQPCVFLPCSFTYFGAAQRAGKEEGERRKKSGQFKKPVAPVPFPAHKQSTLVPILPPPAFSHDYPPTASITSITSDYRDTLLVRNTSAIISPANQRSPPRETRSVHTAIIACFIYVCSYDLSPSTHI